MPNTIQPDGVLLVTLCDVRTDDDIYIHEQLVLRGLAVMEDELNSLIPDEFSSLSNSAINEYLDVYFWINEFCIDKFVLGKWILERLTVCY